MKKIIFVLLMIFTITLASCSLMNMNDISNSNNQNTLNESSVNQNTANQNTNKVNEVKESEQTTESKNDDSAKKEFDYFNSYDKEIEAEVKSAVENASSVQDEINKIKNIADTYSKAIEKANTQNEINFSSAWTFTVWDKELNNLWKRVSDSVDKERKEYLLDEQRKWIAMKEEVMLINIGRAENSGTIYPLLQNNFLEDITYNRCCLLARELAMSKHEDFTMPARSLYGTFVDNQGTKSVYSFIVTKQNVENDNEAIISIYKLGMIEGTFNENSNGDLDFVSYDEKVKGTIKIFGWEKAVFEVTESKDSLYKVGDKFEFDFAF